jgi:hypothetical protein
VRGLAPQVGRYTLGGAGDSLLCGRSSCVLSKDTYDSFVEDLLDSRLLINIFQKKFSNCDFKCSSIFIEFAFI